MARTWLSIRVDLVEGHGEHLWPRPGRIFAAARSHTFAQLARATDDAFARWDRAGTIVDAAGWTEILCMKFARRLAGAASWSPSASDLHQGSILCPATHRSDRLGRCLHAPPRHVLWHERSISNGSLHSQGLSLRRTGAGV